jgi:hypothetical protein
MKIETTQYSVGEQFAVYFAYGDESGLNDDESVSTVGFENGVMQYDKPEGYRFGHWDITNECDEFALCEITELRGKCITINAVWLKD